MSNAITIALVGVLPLAQLCADCCSILRVFCEHRTNTVGIVGNTMNCVCYVNLTCVSNILGCSQKSLADPGKGAALQTLSYLADLGKARGCSTNTIIIC